MTINLDHPDVIKTIEDMIQSGRFDRREDFIAAAVLQFAAAEQDEFDDEMAAGINLALRQVVSGMTMSVEDAANKLGIELTPNRGKAGVA